MRDDFIQNVVTSTLNIVDLQEERKDTDFNHPTDTCKIYKCDNKTCDKRHPKN